MLQVCNSCGGYDHVGTCAHCPTLVCRHCRMNHESVCKVTSAMKAKGLGPTVRRVEMPLLSVEPTPEPIANEAVKPTDPFAEAGVELLEAVPPIDVLVPTGEDRPDVNPDAVAVVTTLAAAAEDITAATAALDQNVADQFVATLDAETIHQEPPVPVVENENKLDDGHTVTV